MALVAVVAAPRGMGSGNDAEARCRQLQAEAVKKDALLKDLGEKLEGERKEKNEANAKLHLAARAIAQQRMELWQLQVEAKSRAAVADTDIQGYDQLGC